MRLNLRLAFLLAPLLSAAAFAADAPPVQDWSNVETVVVTAKAPGPALWHVAKGASEVWILPTVSPVPKDFSWDSAELARLIKGANAVLLPPRGEVGMFEGLWFFMTDLDSVEQPDGTTLESTLPAPLKARFVAARSGIDEAADRYDKFLGGVAALMLESDYWSFAKLAPNGTEKTVESLASHAGVRARAVAVYPAMNIVRDVPKMSAEAHRVCIDDALQDIATMSQHAAAAAAAWAVGDIDGVKAHYAEIKLDACLAQNNAYAAMRETANRDMTAAILAALDKPGKTVAVMPMGFFLRKGGVLERLEAAGLTVSGPGS
ncbi:MAG TPA: TraB/GumN family protein [Rhizomicrobium sp.]